MATEFAIVKMNNTRFFFSMELNLAFSALSFALVGAEISDTLLADALAGVAKTVDIDFAWADRILFSAV